MPCITVQSVGVIMQSGRHVEHYLTRSFFVAAALQLPEVTAAAGASVGGGRLLPALPGGHYICPPGLLHHQGECRALSSILTHSYKNSHLSVERVKKKPIVEGMGHCYHSLKQKDMKILQH